MTDQSHDIKVLNSLIATTIDSVHGYREAAKEAQNPSIKQRFEGWSSDRASVVASLQQRVAAFGGKPEDDGTALASIHRVFMDLRASMSKGDKAVIEEAERGEDHIKAKFEDALKDDKLSSEARAAVQQASSSVMQGHNEMRSLKQSVQDK